MINNTVLHIIWELGRTAMALLLLSGIPAGAGDVEYYYGMHNNSLMQIESNGQRLIIRYEQPSPILTEVYHTRKGSVLFEGVRYGSRVTGTAYWEACDKYTPYEASGWFEGGFPVAGKTLNIGSWLVLMGRPSAIDVPVPPPCKTLALRPPTMRFYLQCSGSDSCPPH
jgi:hypothetical protein